jgi:hypothetical protein
LSSTNENRAELLTEFDVETSEFTAGLFGIDANTGCQRDLE